MTAQWGADRKDELRDLYPAARYSPGWLAIVLLVLAVVMAVLAVVLGGRG